MRPVGGSPHGGSIRPATRALPGGTSRPAAIRPCLAAILDEIARYSQACSVRTATIASTTAPKISRLPQVTRVAAAKAIRVAPSAMPTPNGRMPTGAKPARFNAAATPPTQIASQCAGDIPRQEMRGQAQGVGTLFRLVALPRVDGLPSKKSPDPVVSRRRIERLLQIGDEVVRVLDAARQADHVVRDADTRGDPPACTGSSSSPAAARSATRRRPGSARSAESARHRRCRPSARQSASLTRNVTRPPKPRIVPPGHVVIRVRFEARVVHLFDARMRFEKLGHALAVFVVPLHPQLERLQAAATAGNNSAGC